MLIVVGLGNFGKEYENTYHNMGFDVVGKLATALDVKIKDKKCKALVGETFVSGEKVVLALPQTYMNLSGDSVKELIGYYGATMQDVLVVYDDIDMPAGALRIRREGSAGTHNGMRDIVAKTNTKDFVRVRVGTGRPPEYMTLADFVLSKVRGDNKTKIDEAQSRAVQAIEKYIRNRDIELIMREYNS